MNLYNQKFHSDILLRNKEKWLEAGGVCHSFTSDATSLQRLIDEGFYIGINGCSLKTPENLDVLRRVPLDRIMLETGVLSDKYHRPAQIAHGVE